MDRKRLLNRRGSVLLESAIAMPMLVALSYYLLLTTIGAFSNATFAAYTCVAENFIQNEMACIRAADVASDGSLTLPTLSQVGGYSLATPTVENDVAIFGPDSHYRATVTTQRRQIESVAATSQSAGKTVYEYTITVAFAYPSTVESLRTFTRSGTVRLVTQQ